MSKNALVVKNCTKRFGDNVVFEECSFDIQGGSIFGLVGLNGAGKTTLIRLLAGLLRPDSGHISIFDFVPWNHEEQLYRRLGIVLENDGFAGNMDLKDNLKFFATAKNLAWPVVEEYIRQFWSDTFISHELHSSRKKVKHFSRGQKMQCGICRAFLGWPDVYLFDEPTVALDVEAYDHFCGLARYAQRRGGTILISSHQLSFIEELCDAVGILDDKKLHPLPVGLNADGDAHTQKWVIIAPEEETMRDIIERHCGNKAIYTDNSWHFNVEKPDVVIPDLITSLCAAGCRIREVRPEKGELKDQLRMHYEKN